jgi:hypothetical protein
MSLSNVLAVKLEKTYFAEFGDLWAGTRFLAAIFWALISHKKFLNLLDQRIFLIQIDSGR